jgi:raffinose/stachyose/melibiose transport system substrate-binding protein
MPTAAVNKGATGVIRSPIRTLALCAAGALCTTVLTACGTGPGGAAGSDTLRVQVPTGALATSMQKVAADFEKANPGTKVSLESVDSAASRGPNVALLSSSATPDIGYLQRSTGVWSALLKNKQLTDLDDVWSANGLADKYSPSQTAYYTTDGHHYGVLYDELLINPVYYNVDAFKKAGIPTPVDHQLKALSDLPAMVAKLKRAGYQGLGVGGASPYDLGHTLDALLPTAMTPADYASVLTNFKPGSPTTVKYTDPAFVRALQTIADWKRGGVFQDGMLGMDVPQVNALFTSGKLAMVQGGNYSYSDLMGGKPKFGVDWFLLPPVTPGRTTPFDAFNGDTFVVPKKAANPRLAKKFMEFFMTDKYQAGVVVQGGALPVFRSVRISQLAALGKPIQQMVAVSKQVGLVNIWDSTVPTTLGQAFAVPVLQKLVAGGLTPAQAAARFQGALADLQSGKVSGASD